MSTFCINIQYFLCINKKAPYLQGVDYRICQCCLFKRRYLDNPMAKPL